MNAGFFCYSPSDPEVLFFSFSSVFFLSVISLILFFSVTSTSAVEPMQQFFGFIVVFFSSIISMWFFFISSISFLRLSISLLRCSIYSYVSSVFIIAH